jgi:hypothetical protein
VVIAYEATYVQHNRVIKLGMLKRADIKKTTGAVKTVKLRMNTGVVKRMELINGFG